MRGQGGKKGHSMEEKKRMERDGQQRGRKGKINEKNGNGENGM